MKQKYAFLFLTVLSAVFSCAQIDEGNLEDKVEVEKVAMTFTASIEKNADTKTELGGNVGDALRKVYWQPSDKIGVTVGDASDYAGYPPVEVFTSTSSSRTEKAEFEGTISFSSSYHAFYPYSTELRDSCGVFVFNLPQVQKYVRGTFDPNAAPMAAKASAGEELQFRNLCGILALQLKGTGSVKSITFMGRDEMGQPMDVAGSFEVNMLTDDFPNLNLKSNPKSSVTLECGEAVALSSASDTPFYLVLPPSTYPSFMVLITMADGRVMIKEGTKPLTIKRSDIANASSLTYVESVALDLSERGNSNCYIVPKAGIYSFDASVIGNREFGLMEGFHTDNVKISPSSVSLLWEDRNGVVLSPSVDGNKVKFIATGREGNALLAVNDVNGQTLWSWHIWVTDQPQEQVYVNDSGTFTMLDRNVGATHNASDDWMNSRGLVYQWGRKEPFTMNESGSSPMFSTNKTQATLAESVANPTVFEGATYRGWVTPENTLMWYPSKKTIYDPCPVGYRVPPREVWLGFLMDGQTSQHGITEKYNVSGGWDNGWNFIYDGVNSTYYPAASRIQSDGYYWTWNESDRCHMWSSNYYNERYAYRLYFYFHTDSDSYIETYHSTDATTAAYPVRCMKDDGYVDTSLPTVHIKNFTDKTSSSARVVCEVTYPGSAEVTERGFVWSTNSDFSTSTKVPCGSGAGEYAMTINGLSEATRYFVKPYAVNSYGTSYGAVKQFVTAYPAGGLCLSDSGTSNSYMIYPNPGVFYFDATVKGNSFEPLDGIPYDAEVLWETRNGRKTVSAGDIISQVDVVSDMVFFKTPEDVVPGNALIAVKDENGTILWSWHIWVVDFDPEETRQVYKSGAVMMDRNLGALSAEPGDEDSFGFYYQWGRKDPMDGPGSYQSEMMTTYPADAFRYEETYSYPDFDTMEYCIQNPTTILHPTTWNDVDGLWDSNKTKYDPCPPGWMVPTENAWNWIGIESGLSSEYVKLSSSYSDPEAYFPTAGATYGDNSISHMNECGHYWTTTRSRFMRLYWNQNPYIETRSVYNQLSVRCMKEN